MGNMSGCHCMSQAMPQNIQQHTTVIVTITYDRPSSECLLRLNSRFETKQPARPIRKNSTVPTQKGADELAYAIVDRAQHTHSLGQQHEHGAMQSSRGAREGEAYLEDKSARTASELERSVKSGWMSGTRHRQQLTERSVSRCRQAERC